MIVGDVVPQAVIRVDRPNVKATFKPVTGKVAMLLLLGDVDKKDPDSFDSVKALKNLGWVKEEELTAARQLLKDILNSRSTDLTSEFWDRINQVLAAV